MYKTKNDLPEPSRGQLVELCNARLADAIWNVKGPDFIALHELFDRLNEDVESYIDMIAERAVQLGGIADGTLRSAAKRSSLHEYSAVGGSGHAHVEALSTTLAMFGKHARNAITQCSELGDADSTDLFTEVSRGTDKWLWFIEAHLQAER